MARSCPNCSTEMRIEEMHGVKLDVCPECASIWLDSGELRTLLAQDPLALSELEDLIELEDLSELKIEQQTAGPSLRRCPACSMPLEEYNYLYSSSIVLDVCPDCGGFLVEEGELGKMQEWLNDAHRPVTEEDERRLTLAAYAIEHDNEMHRQRNLLQFFNMLRQFQPGWIGLLP